MFLGYTKLISRAQGPHVVPPVPCMVASVWSWCNCERDTELKTWLNVTGVSLLGRDPFHSVLTGLVEGFSMAYSHSQVLGWQTEQDPGPQLRWFTLNSSPAAQGQPSLGWPSIFPLPEPSPLCNGGDAVILINSTVWGVKLRLALGRQFNQEGTCW